MTWYRAKQGTAENGLDFDLFRCNYTHGVNLPEISSQNKYTGNYSYYFSASTDGVGWAGIPLSQWLRCGAWIRYDLGTYYPNLIIFRGYNDMFYNYWDVSIDDSQNLRVGYVSSTPGASDFITVPSVNYGLSMSKWHHVSAIVVSGSIHVFIDGVERVVHSAASIRPTTNVTFGGGGFGAFVFGPEDAFFDDIYIDYAADGSFDVPPGKRFLTLKPIAAGNDAEWSPQGAASNFDCVNDDVADESTYVLSASAGQRDTYQFQPTPSLPIGTKIVAALVYSVARKSDPGLSAKLKLVVDDGTLETVGDEEDLTSAYAPVYHRFPTQPNGQLWTAEGIDSCRFGFESSGTFSTNE